MAGRNSKRQTAYEEQVASIFATYGDDMALYTDDLHAMLVTAQDKISTLIMSLDDQAWRTTRLAEIKAGIDNALLQFEVNANKLSLEMLEKSASSGMDIVISPVKDHLDFSIFPTVPQIFTPSVSDPDILAFWNLNQTMISNVTQEAGQKIWSTVVQGVGLDAPNDEILRGIVKELGGDRLSFKTVGHRAETILRTESAKLHQLATQRQMQYSSQFLPEARKEWHHGIWGFAQSARPGHLALDGVVVDINEPFFDPFDEVYLMHPHDPNAPAGSVINCSCGHSLKMPDDIFLRDRTLINV